MNLNEETLIPFRTMATTRDGTKCVYIGPSNAQGQGYHSYFLPINGTYPGLSGFHTSPLGKYYVSSLCDSALDIVRIIRPWTPKIGEIVTVHGVAAKYNGNHPDSHYFFSLPRSEEDSQAIKELYTAVVKSQYSSYQDFYIIGCSGMDYIIHKDNLRRAK